MCDNGSRAAQAASVGGIGIGVGGVIALFGGPIGALIGGTLAMQGASAAATLPNAMNSALENEENTCDQIAALRKQKKGLDDILNTVQQASAIDDNVRNQLSNMTMFYQEQIALLKQQNQQFRKSLYTNIVIDIFITLCVVLFILYKARKK